MLEALLIANLLVLLFLERKVCEVSTALGRVTKALESGDLDLPLLDDPAAEAEADERVTDSEPGVPRRFTGARRRAILKQRHEAAKKPPMAEVLAMMDDDDADDR